MASAFYLCVGRLKRQKQLPALDPNKALSVERERERKRESEKREREREIYIHININIYIYMLVGR